MKILLIGEYSRLHNSLKEGLTSLGHEVTILGDGDSFKNYPMDISVRPNYINANWFTRKVKVGFYKLTRIDLQQAEVIFRFQRQKYKLKGYDVVQFINSNALKTPLWHQKKQVEFLKKHNRKLFLLACGTDTPIVEYLLEGKMKYHILTPYLQEQLSAKNFKYEFKYVSKSYKEYFSFFKKLMNGFIASDMDYYLPLKDHPKLLALIPNPVNIEKMEKIASISNSKVHVFLGINELSKHKKGSIFFEEAISIVKKKFGSKINVTIARSLPYEQYIKKYENADILLDMVYAYDQGYNALEAMAQGKVVFTGAEKEFLDHYNLKEDEVCINALPEVDYLVEKLSWLIENPHQIKQIGKNAQEFVIREHNYITIAKKYVEVWGNN